MIYLDTDLLRPVCGFDISEDSVYEAGEAERSARYAYEPMVRAFYCKELAGFTTIELYEYLSNSEPAGALGFNLGHFAEGMTAPSQATFNRACPDRFLDHFTSLIHVSTKRILAVVHKLGDPLGMQALDPENKSDVTNQLKQRYVTNKTKEVILTLCKCIFPAIGPE